MKFFHNPKTNQYYVLRPDQTVPTIFGQEFPASVMLKEGFMPSSPELTEMELGDQVVCGYPEFTVMESGGSINDHVLRLFADRVLICPFTGTRAIVKEEQDPETLNILGGVSPCPAVGTNFYITVYLEDGEQTCRANVYSIWNLVDAKTGNSPAKYVTKLHSWFGSKPKIEAAFKHHRLTKWKSAVAEHPITTPFELEEVRKVLRSMGWNDEVSHVLDVDLSIKKPIIEQKTRVYHVETNSVAINLTVELELYHDAVFGISVHCRTSEGDLVDECSWCPDPRGHITEFDFLKAIATFLGESEIYSIQNVNSPEE